MKQPNKNKKKLTKVESTMLDEIELSLQRSDFNEAFPGREDEYQSMEEMAGNKGDLRLAGGWPEADMSFWNGRQYTDEQKEYMTEYTPADQTPYWQEDADHGLGFMEMISGVKAVKGVGAAKKYGTKALDYGKKGISSLYKGAQKLYNAPNKANALQTMIQAAKTGAITKGSSIVQSAKNLPTWATENLAKKLAGESVDISTWLRKKTVL